MAQNMMGLCYATGQGVDMNVDDAEYWYQLAAAQGLQIAQTNMETVIERKATKNDV
jgi:TPR repeat protein